MSRNLADLQKECASLNIEVDMTGCKKASKALYENALRDFYWTRDHSGEGMPEQIVTMLARNSKNLPKEEVASMMADGSEWVGQEKINGCRAVIRFRSGGINHVTSRNRSDEHYRYNELHGRLPHYRDIDLGEGWDDTILDGEIISSVAVVDTSVFDGKGVKTLDILQATAALLNCGEEKSVALQEKFGKLIFCAFDCLRFMGKDVRDLPYVVLDANGDIDLHCESRYRCAILIVERLIEVAPDMDYSQWEPELPKHDDSPLPEPAVIQEDAFAELMDG